MKWNVFDKDDKWLGCVYAGDEEAALKKAREVFHLTTADHVEERDEIIYREGAHGPL